VGKGKAGKFMKKDINKKPEQDISVATQAGIISLPLL
jgi:hypothetical protein